jgi:uncharacterized repeat protein (TIGR04138 family)
MSQSDRDFWDVVDALRERNPRYRREAYAFVVGALGVTVQSLPADRRADPARRHLSGRELLRGVIRLARREFGSLAPIVFQEWGVRRGEDVGAIVFELVEAGQLSARPEDTIEDFREWPDLTRALADPGATARN